MALKFSSGRCQRQFNSNFRRPLTVGARVRCEHFLVPLPLADQKARWPCHPPTSPTPSPQPTLTLHSHHPHAHRRLNPHSIGCVFELGPVIACLRFSFKACFADVWIQEHISQTKQHTVHVFMVACTTRPLECNIFAEAAVASIQSHT